jgi:hypothetical protein
VLWSQYENVHNDSLDDGVCLFPTCLGFPKSISDGTGEQSIDGHKREWLRDQRVCLVPYPFSAVTYIGIDEWLESLSSV